MEATISHPPFYVYITTNQKKNVLNVGYTHHLPNYLNGILEDNQGSRSTFAGRTASYHLLYVEQFEFAVDAIFRVIEIKSWSRTKKQEFIQNQNPTWAFLNPEHISNPIVVPA